MRTKTWSRRQPKIFTTKHTGKAIQANNINSKSFAETYIDLSTSLTENGIFQEKKKATYYLHGLNLNIFNYFSSVFIQYFFSKY